MLKQILTISTMALLGLAACTPKDQSAKNEADNMDVASFPERSKDMNIYEVNIRQYTPEGTINAFTAHLPRLEKMGVDILWVMPVQPISEKNRKGPLGSYYSIQDYTAINPNFGTEEDFKAFVEEAHERNMLVILDWVANHTGFDHAWTNKDGYHTTDSAGNIIWPKGTDWTDVADLNYDNADMRQEMIDEMQWWITEMDIDGFRCDVAGEVPNDFWTAAIDSLQKEKDVFMLAEWDEPKMHDAGFHMTYGWGPHHWMNETAKGHYNADSFQLRLQEDLDRYQDDAIRMMFTTNHDENSWNGTVFERLGEGHKAYAVYNFTIYGMPLIYSGQEAGLDKRLRFFDKDTIDWSDVKYEAFYKSLISLKKENSALHNGAYGAVPEFLEDGNAHVFSFKRAKGDNEVTVIINMSDEHQEAVFVDESLYGTHEDYFTNEAVEISAEALSLTPFQYYVFVK